MYILHVQEDIESVGLVIVITMCLSINFIDIFVNAQVTGVVVLIRNAIPAQICDCLQQSRGR